MRLRNIYFFCFAIYYVLLKSCEFTVKKEGITYVNKLFTVLIQVKKVYALNI